MTIDQKKSDANIISDWITCRVPQPSCLNRKRKSMVHDSPVKAYAYLACSANFGTKM